MVDPKLGTKRVCEACGAKFYDLNKTPASCPKCGQVFDPLAAMTPEQPVREVEPTAENKDGDDDGELEEDENALSLEDMVDEETDDEDDDSEETLEQFSEGEALLDDNNDDETLLEDEEEEESFLEDEDDDDA
jgi:uncharacterized protein (TIGR02300 family)